VGAAAPAPPAVVAEAESRTRTVLASADDDAVETTSSTSTAPLDIRPPTTTPGSRRAGLQALPGAAQAYAGAASQAPFPSAGGKSTARLPAVEGVASRAEGPPKDARSDGAKPVTPSPWVIQLGAMDDEDKAKSILADARSRTGMLSKAAPYTVRVTHGGTTLYRARFSGFSEQSTAQDACTALKKNGFNCFATRS
jgi:D-alanyl-D-alanine carboxypeptidase